ncbi:hypothetical protein UCRNP2_7841 [Neofusicoccum parvum UCRNP2]|uniref:Uncharacterized protein n=1 Tax=Botryosphaeria parva (strain UCR-NP2) TaxID=1287680 RepID=R1GHK8_BOTPV|nr:hypothetical protein UCRNP2_7841 [Neofusicoccum parvum UCRNP2]
MPRGPPPDMRPLNPPGPALRPASFDFLVYLPQHRQGLARVLNHVRRVANRCHGAGGCSAFQVAVELARCLIVAFVFSAQGPSPGVDAATRLALHCFALVGIYEDDVHIDSANTDDFEGICERFANRLLGTLAERVGRQPAVLASSVFHSVRTVIYKAPDDAASCVLEVSRFLAQSLREHNIAVHPANISRAFEKVLAACAFWNGIVVGRTFAIAFMQYFLPGSTEDPLLPGPAVLTVGALATTKFIRLVAWCAIWRWVVGHGWTAFNIPKFVNKARDLRGIWSLEHGSFRNWQRKASAMFRR